MLEDKNREFTEKVYIPRNISVVQKTIRLTKNGVAKPCEHDLTSDTFLKAWVNFDSFSRNAPVVNWLISIARNTVLDWLRQRSTVGELHSVSIENPLAEEQRDFVLELRDQFGWPDPFVFTDWGERIELVKRALQALPGHSRMIFEMAEVEGLSYSEIAQVLGVKEQHVRNTQFKTWKRLRASAVVD